MSVERRSPYRAKVQTGKTAFVFFKTAQALADSLADTLSGCNDDLWDYQAKRGGVWNPVDYKRYVTYSDEHDCSARGYYHMTVDGMLIATTGYIEC